MSIHYTKGVRALIVSALIVNSFGCFHRPIHLNLNFESIPHHHSISTGCFYGFVVDQKGVPIEGASVFLESSTTKLQATTDKAGRFSINDIQPDSYLVTARKDGFMAIKLIPNIEIAPDSEHHQLFALKLIVPIDDFF